MTANERPPTLTEMTVERLRSAIRSGEFAPGCAPSADGNGEAARRVQHARSRGVRCARARGARGLVGAQGHRRVRPDDQRSAGDLRDPPTPRGPRHRARRAADDGRGHRRPHRVTRPNGRGGGRRSGPDAVHRVESCVPCTHLLGRPRCRGSQRADRRSARRLRGLCRDAPVARERRSPDRPPTTAAIVEACRERDSTKAGRAMRAHLGHTVDALSRDVGPTRRPRCRDIPPYGSRVARLTIEQIAQVVVARHTKRGAPEERRMLLARTDVDHAERWGFVEGEHFHLAPHHGPTLRDALGIDHAGLCAFSAETSEHVATSEVRFLAPIAHPPQFLGVGLELPRSRCRIPGRTAEPSAGVRLPRERCHRSRRIDRPSGRLRHGRLGSRARDRDRARRAAGSPGRTRSNTSLATRS